MWTRALGFLSIGSKGPICLSAACHSKSNLGFNEFLLRRMRLRCTCGHKRRPHASQHSSDPLSPPDAGRRRKLRFLPEAFIISVLKQFAVASGGAVMHWRAHSTTVNSPTSRRLRPHFKETDALAFAHPEDAVLSVLFAFPLIVVLHELQALGRPPDAARIIREPCPV